MKTKGVIYCGLFTALIAVGAFIKIPIPVVPFTLQYLFTMLAGLLLGSRLGTVSVLSYMLLGLAGLPIFSEGGGLWYVFKPSFGYIIGFAVAAYVNGKIANAKTHPSYRRLLGANFLGLFIVYSFGMIYLNSPIGVGALFLYCFVLAVPGDIVLCIVAAIIGKRMIPLIQGGRLG